MYAIVDIETTGGNVQKDKITEIAVLLTDGSKLLRQFSTLINPECNIPWHITEITGITNEMVAAAPKFYEIAKDLLDCIGDAVIVAHNASFDYNFIKSEYKRLGYNFTKDRLCTVVLSRKLISGLTSYSLGNLCQALQIKITDRHRALGDAKATEILFSRLLALDREGKTQYTKFPGVNTKGVHPKLDLAIFKTLPEQAGVYYFYNEQNDLLYIGKSKNIRNRILTHFNNVSSRRAIELKQSICNIDYELTGSEIIALLKESEEIKQLKPKYNRAQRRTMDSYGLYYYSDAHGYIRLSIDKNNRNGMVPLASFGSKRSAHNFMHNVIEEHRLCQKLCGMYPSDGACFHYEIMECNGACIGEEPANDYNKRVSRIIEQYTFSYESFLLLDKGREDHEKSVIKVEHGKFIGYGYADLNYTEHMEQLSEVVSSHPDNKEVQHIIRNCIKKGNYEKLITL